MADALNEKINIVTLAGVIGIVAWAFRFTRTAAIDRAAAAAANRRVVKEIGRLRMAERDSTEITKMVLDIRRRLAERPDEWAAGYIAGRARRPDDGRPPLRPVG